MNVASSRRVWRAVWRAVSSSFFGVGRGWVGEGRSGVRERWYVSETRYPDWMGASSGSRSFMKAIYAIDGVVDADIAAAESNVHSSAPRQRRREPPSYGVGKTTMSVARTFLPRIVSLEGLEHNLGPGGKSTSMR